MFERFTDRARHVLVVAQEEARLLNHSFVGTEHLLLGLVQGDGLAAQALGSLDISLAAVREKVEEKVGVASTAPSGSPPFTPRAKKVLELSLREALQLGHSYIGTEHLLLGVVREGEGMAAQVVVEIGADLVRVRQAVIRLMASGGQAVSEGGADPAPTARTRHLGGARVVSCSFCGRLPPESGRLVSGSNAFICEHCLREWSGRIGVEGMPGTRAGVRSELPAPAVHPTGPPPEDPGAAVAAITAAFAAHGIPSEDGQSVPTVEGGQNLGAALAMAQTIGARRIGAEHADAEVSVGDVVFYDAAHAAVTFTISVNGRPMLRDHRGDAVVVDGEWKMARSTFCALMAMVGVQCPPPPAGPGG